MHTSYVSKRTFPRSHERSRAEGAASPPGPPALLLPAGCPASPAQPSTARPRARRAPLLLGVAAEESEGRGSRGGHGGRRLLRQLGRRLSALLAVREPVAGHGGAGGAPGAGAAAAARPPRQSCRRGTPGSAGPALSRKRGGHAAGGGAAGPGRAAGAPGPGAALRGGLREGRSAPGGAAPLAAPLLKRQTCPTASGIDRFF